jgi:HEPN domain-containing protein
MPPEEKEVRRWLEKARNDWSAARKIFTPDCVELDTAAFHCQQAVEKTLKAYLVSQGINFEKVHDLGRLLDHCASADAEFESLRDAVEPLTLYAVAFRYPGPAEPARQDVESALRVVDGVWTFVTSRLRPEVLP